MPKYFLKINSFFALILALLVFLVPLRVFAYELEIKIPGLSTQSVTDPGTYVRYLFIFGLYLAGFLAVAVIAWGGINYMLASSASVGGVEKAKKWILGALGGIILLLCAWLVLYTIDPTLIDLSSQISVLSDIAEPPSPPDSGLTEGSVAVAGAQSIQCKTDRICQDISGGQVSSTLIRSLSSLPLSVTLTETTSSHGCSNTDTCVPGAACGTSTHCSGRAADIRISNLTDSQKQQVMQALSSDKCVDQLFYSGLPQYCRASGGQNASGSDSCASHTDHIHYSVKAGCT